MKNGKILITGAKGFIGRNLTVSLLRKGYKDLLLYDIDSDPEDLDRYCRDCDFIFHLAGVNRPQKTEEFYEGNKDFSARLISLLEKHENHCPVVVSSSIQAELDNDYGKSKKRGEELFINSINNPAYIFRLYGVFGKWSRPNYNTVVATFMYNVIHDLPVTISDRNRVLTLCHIDDVVAKFISMMENSDDFGSGYYHIDTLHNISLGELYDLICSFKRSREDLVMPSLDTLLKQRLYGMFLSYLDTDKFAYMLEKKEDNRGFLAEFIKSDAMGQIFVSTTKPGITRGNHWHHTKVEKFFVIKGHGLISFRHLVTGETVSYEVWGDQPEVVDIPVGYTHNIKNIGDDEMICLFWSSQIFDPQAPDTYYEEV